MSWSQFLSLLVTTGVLLVHSVRTQSPNVLLALEGTVKWHKSDASVKSVKVVSQLNVHLYSLPEETPRQAVKVLPNGAFFVPVSVSGRYRLKLSAPQGWNFLPKDGFDVDLSEGTAVEPNKYVFELTGFDVSGRVITTGMTTGPPGLYVSVMAEKNIISQTTTAGDGSFSLQSVPPGDYVIVVSDTKAINGPEGSRANIPITVSTNSLQINQPIVLQVCCLNSRYKFF